MGILYALESIRFPALDTLMLLLTRLGEETAFLVIALVIFWCVDKRRGYYLMAVGFLGTIFSQFLKLACRVPRPWVLDENFTIVEQAREAASGYSFPSGHTQTAVGTFGALAYTAKKRWMKALFIGLMTLVAFSRMYLGVHTPKDVLVGALISLVLVIGLQPLALDRDERNMKYLLAVMTGIALGYLLYVEFARFPADVDVHNLTSGQKNAYTLLGSLIGVDLVYLADRKLDFPVEAVWWVQIIKAAMGLLLVLAVKEGLRSPLEAVLPVLIARAVRYFLIVMTAGILWPLSFRYLAKLGKTRRVHELRNH